jgi:N-acetylmuramoyl-L-alanine amidase
MPTLPVISRPSPNHGPRLDVTAPDMLILHYTGMLDAESALARLCDPESQVSAHFVIDEAGLIYRLVDESRRAWHAGVSSWRGVRDINSRSIGIELVNPGHDHGYRSFPKAQMAALTDLAGDVVRRFNIPPLHVVGHSDIAPGRKQDPGELFDWQSLAASGIGAWPDAADPAATSDHTTLLRRLGYRIDSAGDVAPALQAFQRHWHPEALDQGINLETIRRLRNLVRQFG